MNRGGALSARKKGDRLDISTDGDDGRLSEIAGGAAQPSGGRRFVGIHFACCSVYSRIYLNRDESGYVGNCPKCARQVRFQIGPGGTDARFFTAR